MKIFHRNATALLLEKASSISERPNSWRCIHLTLSEENTQYNQALLTCFMARGLSRVLAEDDGYIYLCSDGDIFILFQGAVKPILKRLADRFADIDLGYGNANDEDSFFTIYDLSTAWSDFFGVCYLKSMTSDKPHDNVMHRYMTEQQAAELISNSN
ncbi:MAG: hypothetical protein ACN2B6_07255 [Rickettsiales bacterium]